MNKYGVASNHWWFAHPLYTCRDLGNSPPGYKGWDAAKTQAKPCDNYNCLKVKVDKFGAPRVAPTPAKSILLRKGVTQSFKNTVARFD